MTPIITVKNLVKKYQKAETNAVDDITFHVNEGAFFAFLGPNGAGKTTTISILTTTLSKTSGEITIAGYDLEKEHSHVRRNMGLFSKIQVWIEISQLRKTSDSMPYYMDFSPLDRPLHSCRKLIKKE